MNQKIKNVNQLKAEYLNGVSVEVLAKKYNCNKSRIYQLLDNNKNVPNICSTNIPLRIRKIMKEEIKTDIQKSRSIPKTKKLLTIIDKL